MILGSIEDVKILGFLFICFGICFVLYKAMPKKCCWCSKKITIFSKQQEVVIDGISFCCVQCSLKFMNEAADLKDRVDSAGKSTNININDRNKYLK